MGETDASGAAAGTTAPVGELRPGAALALDASTRSLPGVGPATAGRLAAAGVSTVRELLAFFPHRHRLVVETDRPCDELVGRVLRMPVRVDRVQRAFLGGGRSVVHVWFLAAAGTSLRASFFNQPWLVKVLAQGQERRLEARLERSGRNFELREVELLAARDPLRGECRVRYRAIDGVSESRLRALIGFALDHAVLDGFTPELPRGLRHELPDDPSALLRAMHAPVDVVEHERARVHFALIEAVGLFRRLEAARRRRCAAVAPRITMTGDHPRRLAEVLDFVPTADQSRAMQAVRAMLAGGEPMGLLLQGDVGTGKTAVAVDAALLAVGHGGQVAFLAPTELLAEQHAGWIAPRLSRVGVRVACLTGSLGAHERKELASALASGTIDVVVGTHALMSESTSFRDLALVIVDEHQRFGVEERRRLTRKGRAPHLLVMTATPIPRTLTLALFGDLDSIELRERPTGRPPAPALFVPRKRWPRVLRVIDRHVRRGGRVYVVCPRIGEDGSKGGAIRMFAELAPHARCGLVHGRMSADERRSVIEAFRDGRLDLLVGTTVLEVGVDVADATLMVVIAAERFGLATLHQLRGRVGRGARKGVCVLTGEITARTAAIVATRDGFALAEEDLRLRGAGELCGNQQSGAFDFHALEPLEDYALLRAARDAVRAEEEVT